MDNYTTFIENFWEYSLRGYNTSLGFLFYPIIIGAILGYIYLKTQSGLATTVGIILVFVGYATTGLFANVGPFAIFLQIIATLTTVGLIVVFITRWRK